jgi:hypothetical protein
LMRYNMRCVHHSHLSVRQSNISAPRHQDGTNREPEAMLDWWQVAHDKHIGHTKIDGLESVDGKPRPGMTPSIVTQLKERRQAWQIYQKGRNKSHTTRVCTRT